MSENLSEIGSWSLSGLESFLNANPWLNLAGILVGLIGIGLAILFFAKSQRKGKPCYAILSSNLVRDFASRFEALEVRYRGEAISNFTSTNVAFWNDGKESIRKEDIPATDPLMVKISEEYQILDVYRLFPEKSPNQFEEQLSDDKQYVLIKFDYIDPDEGVVLKLLHTGTSSDDIELSGTIIGAGSPKKRRIRPFVFPVVRSSRHTTRFASIYSRQILGSVFFLYPLLLILVGLLGGESEKFFSVPSIMIVGSLSIVMWGLGYSLFKRRLPKKLEVFEKDI